MQSSKLTTAGYAKYIGRVGALAVALGITGAVATSPSPAWADETSSATGSEATSESTSTSSGSSPSSQDPASTAPTNDDVDETDVEESDAGIDDAASGDDESNADETEDGDEQPQPEPEAPVDDDETSAQAPTDGGESDNRETLQNDSRTEQFTSAIADEPEAAIDVDAGGPTQSSDETESIRLFVASDVSDVADESRRTSAEFTTSTVQAPTAGLAAAPGSFIQVAMDLISTALTSFLVPDPTAPTETPLLWAVLGWVRRQFGAAFDDPTPPAAQVVTTLALDEEIAAAALPADFERTVLASGLDSPTDMAFLPDGSIVIAEQNGTIKLFHEGHLHDGPVAVLNANSDGERGLLGIEIDPAFDENGNGFIYVSYTNAETNRDRLSRLTVTDYTADPASELVLVESDKTASSIHHGGEVSFDLSGEHLYWSVGDNIFAPNAQDLSTIHGKILRINPDGSIPEDNPFVDTPDARPEIYAYGFRNPFRFAFAPDGTPEGTLLVGDVGSASWEELNVVRAGANYGWPDAEGVCNGCESVNPIYTYPHTTGIPQQGSITSVLVYTGSAFGEEYQNKVFIADYAIGWMKTLSFDPKYESFIGETMFDEQAGTTVKLVQGPDEKIYQLTIFPGELSVIAPSGGNRAPTAVVTATPSNGLSPLDVQFSSEGSSDPEGATLTYTWDFGDGGAGSTEANPLYTYTVNGTYDVTLTVNDGERTATAIQRITVGNRAPTATILTPSNNAQYSAGDTISFTGTGSDPDNDDLTYEWNVVFHHEEHIHPFQDDIAGQSGSVVIPRTADNLPTTWYRIHLTVTDTAGLSSTTFVDVKPRIVDLTFNTSDPGTTITIDGVPHQGGYTQSAVVGVEHVISAPSPQFVGGQELEFSHWSNGRPQTHTIVVPATNTDYTATFDVVNTEPIEAFAILKQIVRNQTANVGRLVDGFRTGQIVAAITDIASTTVTRTLGAAAAAASNGAQLVLAVVRAPAEVGGTLVTTANRLVAALSDFDPLGALSAIQTGAVAFRGELSHQINVIGRAVGDLRGGILEAVSVPLPPAA